MNRPRVAFFTPLTPQKSGITDYSEELLPYLAEHLDIDVVIGDYEPAPSEITRAFRVLRVKDFLQSAASYQISIYQIANSYDHHAYMVPAMAAAPGIVVLHDCCLQYLVLGLTLRQGSFKALERAISGVYGARTRGIVVRLLLGLEDPNTITFARPFLDMSRAVIVHSEDALNYVRAHSRNPARVIPMGVPIDDKPAAVDELRAQYGFEQDDFIIFTASTLSRSKRMDLVVRAVAAVKPKHPRVRLIMIGGGSLGEQTRDLIRELGLTESFQQTGWVSRREYNDLIALGDVAIDMRYPSGGETSASLSRGLAAGKPAIVSAQRTFLELPDTICRKIAVGEGEVARLAEAISFLIEHPAERLRMGEAAREFAASHCSLPWAARQYADFVLEQLVNGPPSSNCAGVLPASSRNPAIASLYKCSRLVYLYRTYGLRDTWRRFREELRSAIGG